MSFIFKFMCKQRSTKTHDQKVADQKVDHSRQYIGYPKSGLMNEEEAMREFEGLQNYVPSMTEVYDIESGEMIEVPNPKPEPCRVYKLFYLINGSLFTVPGSPYHEPMCQVDVGKIYYVEGPIEPRENGYHGCYNLDDLASVSPRDNVVVHEVLIGGSAGIGDHKIVWQFGIPKTVVGRYMYIGRRVTNSNFKYYRGPDSQREYPPNEHVWEVTPEGYGRWTINPESSAWRSKI